MSCLASLSGRPGQRVRGHRLYRGNECVGGDRVNPRFTFSVPSFTVSPSRVIR